MGLALHIRQLPLPDVVMWFRVTANAVTLNSVFGWYFMGCIYIVKNLINGKCYIGQTINLIRRKRSHKRSAKNGSGYVFHCALRKHGFDNFEWFILYDNLDDDEIDLYEMAAIRKFKTIAPDGYNLNCGGNRPSPTNSTKCCISNTLKKYFQDNPEARMKCGDAARGKPRPRIAVEKMIKTNIGRKCLEETKEKIRQKAIGRLHTADTREKIRQAAKNQKNRINPPNNTGYVHSEETKRRRSESMKMRYYILRSKKFEYAFPTCFV